MILSVINITITREMIRQIPVFGQMSDLIPEKTKDIIVTELMNVQLPSTHTRAYVAVYYVWSMPRKKPTQI